MLRVERHFNVLGEQATGDRAMIHFHKAFYGGFI